MARLVHALLLGILGAGVVHIVVLLLVPSYSERDAWAALSQQANFYRMVRLDPPDAPPLVASLDPLFDAVACRFDLRDGVVQIHRDGPVPYWSVSVHDRTGLTVFAVNDRASPQGLLDLVVATPAQMVALRNALPPALDGSVFVEADVGEGVVVVRTFAPDESWEPIILEWLGGIGCTLH